MFNRVIRGRQRHYETFFNHTNSYQFRVGFTWHLEHLKHGIKIEFDAKIEVAQLKEINIDIRQRNNKDKARFTFSKCYHE